jgi:hypothetical protein
LAEASTWQKTVGSEAWSYPFGDDWIRSTGFASKKAVIEFRGTCAKCQAEAA